MIGAGILDGDYVVVKKQLEAEHGELVVVLIDGEATVKRLEKRANKVRLIAENPKFAPIELQPGAENLIQGKVVSVQRYYGRGSI
jgi:SOS-response transcriptional repressor LexA